jgi:hypothetical protein
LESLDETLRVFYTSQNQVDILNKHNSH